jgi:hypothetical protein
MSTRTATYASWKARFESLVGIEQGGLQTDEALAVIGFFNKAIRKAWDSNYWLDVCMVESRTPDSDLLIDFAQPGETEIADVFAVWNTSPYLNALPARVGYTLTRDGVQLIGPTSADPVWIYYRERCPTYTASDTFPYIFFEYVLHAAYADWLRSDGQNDKAAQADAQAEEYLQLEHDKLERQQVMLPAVRINTHLTSRP